MMNTKKIITLAAGLIVGKKLLDNLISSKSLQNKVVLITGGSKGLGLVLAEHLLKEGCHIAICARDEDELSRAKKHLKEINNSEVLSVTCDVSDKNETDRLIKEVINHFGKLDIIINNAGIIQVAPMEAFSLEQYKKAMDIMYWGIANITFSALAHMKARQEGHIVNVTSIGGKVSVPHLLPYCAAKFAATGFSEGCASELRKDNIYVTTIIPGLMRTGSYVNAFFQKGNRKEFKLFSLMSTAPVLTLSADNAAKKIIKAIKEKRSFKVLGFQAQTLMELDHFFPNLMTWAFSRVSQMVPAAHEESSLETGMEIEEKNKNTEIPVFREIGRKAQEEHQRPLS